MAEQFLTLMADLDDESQAKMSDLYEKLQEYGWTPHVCRHTYCSNMAKSGINPKTLQYLMGHSDISVTLNVYTHVNFDDAKAEIARLKVM